MGAESSIGALPAIMDAVGGAIEIRMDGGIRSGQDVIKALAPRASTSAALFFTAWARWERRALLAAWKSSGKSSTSSWRCAV